VQRADLISATGRRSAALGVQSLGGGVRLNNPKIGNWYDDYNGQCRTSVMHLMHRPKNGKPPGSIEMRAGGLILPDGVHLAVLL